MSNLFAICRPSSGIIIKRVPVSAPVQTKIIALFEEFERKFLDGVSEEVPFGGDWKADDDQVLVIDSCAELDALISAANANAVSVTTINTSQFSSENIKGLFVPKTVDGKLKLLIQGFSIQQLLERRYTLFLDSNLFQEMSSTAFSLGSTLVAIADGTSLKFKQFTNLKKVFELNQYYQEASDNQIREFCGNGVLHVDNVDTLIANADQKMRKLIYAVSQSSVLNNYNVDEIILKAKDFNISVSKQNDKIIMPTSRKDAKLLLKFLDESIYQGPISNNSFETNSKRRLS